MAQFARPDGDVTVNTWAATPLWEKLDEVSPSDADFVSNNNNTNDACEVSLSDVSDPSSSSGHVVRYRYSKDLAGSNARNVTVGLYQSTTLVAEQTHSGISEVFTDGSFTLSSGQADAISDYADLRLRFTASGTTGGPGGNRRAVRVSWAELEVPDAAASFPHTLSPSDGVAASVGLTPSRGIALAIEDSAGSGDALGRDADFARAVADLVAGADVADAQLGGPPVPGVVRRIVVLL